GVDELHLVSGCVDVGDSTAVGVGDPHVVSGGNRGGVVALVFVLGRRRRRAARRAATGRRTAGAASPAVASATVAAEAIAVRRRRPAAGRDEACSRHEDGGEDDREVLDHRGLLSPSNLLAGPSEFFKASTRTRNRARKKTAILAEHGACHGRERWDSLGF